MIFNIQKCSIHDGEGLRTLVFFKGCALHCPWCANPESQSFSAEIMEFPHKCISCGICQKICPHSAISMLNSNLLINRNLCQSCFRCTDICYAQSKTVVGKDMEIDELFDEIYKDYSFYQTHGGGVTFSGGEPFMQPIYLTKILKKCKEHNINTVVESCGYGNYAEFKAALPYIDKIFLDIKIFNPAIHKEVTGIDNKIILKNIQSISDFGIPITIRTPIVPAYTDSKENIKEIASWIRYLSSVSDYELLPYHKFGASKYKALGKSYQLDIILPPTDDKMISLVKLANNILQPWGKQCYYTQNNQRKVF